MSKTPESCLVCGEKLKYYTTEQSLECEYCHKIVSGNASCIHGHYVCDECHSKKGIEAILTVCKTSVSQNPITIMQQLMEHPFIYMHGPEHHVMVGAALLTACYNTLTDCRSDCSDIKFWAASVKTLPPLEDALQEMTSRGGHVPGGICGFWGCCGAAVSSGIFISILTHATPLSSESWGLSNLMTSQALHAIGSIGGPRCCKRNSFTAIGEAARFVKLQFGIKLELPEQILCTYAKQNSECLGKKCPYSPFHNR